MCIIYPNMNSINRLAKDLNLESSNKYLQDWELIVADYTRVYEFICYYKKELLNENEKVTLIRLILESYNDYISINGNNSKYEEELEKILIKEKVIFESLIDYWSLIEYDIEDCFIITPFIRYIKGKL